MSNDPLPDDIRDKIARAVERATITVRADFEELPIEGNAVASGDDAADRAEEDRIRTEFESGNVWAWATVTVRAEFMGYIAEEHLGCCSYDSEKDFRQPGGYFDDMAANAKASLAEQIEKLFRGVYQS